MIIIHGDDVVLSRLALLDYKKKVAEEEIISFDGQKINLTQLIEALEAKSLFGTEKKIFIENIFKRFGRVKKLTQDNLLSYLIKNQASDNLIIWEGQETGKTIISLFPKARFINYKIQKKIFNLVDSLFSDNKQSLLLYQDCLKNNSVEIIFSMIIRQIRLLLLIKNNVVAGPSDYQKIAPWQRQKLTNQSKLITIERLPDLYRKLLIIDYQNKTGRSCFDLSKTLELFLIEI